MIYLGSLGRMIGIKCPSSQSTDHGDRYTMTRTLEGGVRAQARPLSARQWQLGLSDASTASDLALLQDFARGAWGAGPWFFLSAEAVNTNILTPRQAALVDREQRTEFANGGPVQVSDGSIAPASLVSVVASGWQPIFTRLPVKPGAWLTWAADVQGNGTVAPELLMTFYNSAGGNLGGHPSAGLPIAGMQRVAVSRIVPTTAAWVSVGIRSTTLRTARAQVSWTERAPQVVSDGRGCAAAVLHGVSENLVLTGEGRTYMNAGFTVSEVI